MVTKTCCVGIIVSLLIAVGVAVGIYFATAKPDSKSESKEHQPDPTTPDPTTPDPTTPDPTTPDPPKSNPFKKLTVLLKTKHSIMVYDLATQIYNKEATINEHLYNIISFDYYNNRTVYYATTAAGSPIQSAFPQEHPSLPAYTGDWIKGSMAVDQVTGKIYVADRVRGKIHIIDVLGQHHKELISGLDGPFDILVSPYKEFIFVLTKSSIAVYTMSGSKVWTLIEHTDLRAMALDFMNETLYYGAGRSLIMYDLKTEKAHTFGYEVISLAIQQNNLLFIDKDRVFHNCITKGTELINCETRSAPKETEPFESVKAYGKMSWIEDVRNLCAKNNGGCQQLCIPDNSEEGYVCECDDGWRLKQDEKNCIEL